MPASHTGGRPPLTPLGSALAGALGAVFANAAVYPLDTVKTRLQALPPNARLPPPAPLVSSITGGSTIASSHSIARDLRRLPSALLSRLKRWQMLAMLFRILKTEGIAGAFKGFSANMINTFSMQFAYFFFHTFLRTRTLRHLSARNPSRSPTLSTTSELLLGAAAGALAQIFTIPVAVIATRQQLWLPPDEAEAEGAIIGPSSVSDTSLATRPARKLVAVQSPSLLETAREIIAEGGPTALWTGLQPGLVLTINPAITYGVFERLKAWRLAGGGGGSAVQRVGSKLSVMESFWLGVASKTLATVVTYPYIFAKVRLQARPSRTPSSARVTAPSALAPATSTAVADPATSDQSYAAIAAHPPSSAAPIVPSDPASQPDAENRISLVRTPSSSQPAQAKAAHGAIALLRRVYAEQGIAGWYQGLGAQIFKAVLCQGILFVSKDQFEEYTWLLINLLQNLRGKLALHP